MRNDLFQRRVRGLCAWFFLMMLIAIGITQQYLSHGSLMVLDDQIAHQLFLVRGPMGLSFFEFVTLFGDAMVVIVAAVVVTTVLWKKRERLFAIGIWLALVPSEAVTFFGKIFFHRPRPAFEAITENSFSFPSGHATSVVAFYGFLLYLYLRKQKSQKARLVAILSFVTLIILVDLSRLYLGVHYLSDVLAGNIVGFVGVLCAIMFVERRSV